MPQLGSQLKRLRQRRQLTVRAVAARSGVSHATISLIERDKTSPSVDTLSAMLDALGTTLVSFFNDLQVLEPGSPFYTDEDLVEIGDEESISYRMLGMKHPNRHILMMRETYQVGADTGGAFSHNAQEAGFVLKGQVEITIGAEVSVLGPGDGYYFDSQSPHRFRNVGREEAEIISAVSPPTY